MMGFLSDIKKCSIGLSIKRGKRNGPKPFKGMFIKENVAFYFKKLIDKYKILATHAHFPRVRP